MFKVHVTEITWGALEGGPFGAIYTPGLYGAIVYISKMDYIIKHKEGIGTTVPKGFRKGIPAPIIENKENKLKEGYSLRCETLTYHKDSAYRDSKCNF